MEATKYSQIRHLHLALMMLDPAQHQSLYLSPLGSVSSSHERLYLLSLFPMMNSSTYRSILPAINNVLGTMSKFFQMFSSKQSQIWPLYLGIICNFPCQTCTTFYIQCTIFKSFPLLFVQYKFIMNGDTSALIFSLIQNTYRYHMV